MKPTFTETLPDLKTVEVLDNLLPEYQGTRKVNIHKHSKTPGFVLFLGFFSGQMVITSFIFLSVRSSTFFENSSVVELIWTSIRFPSS